MTPPPIWFGTDESPPGPGNVMVLYYHHDGESHWCSPEQVRNRVEGILNGDKPEEEWGERMENMRIVPYGEWWKSRACSDAWAVSAKACFDAGAVYDKACSDAGAVYAKACSALWGEEFNAETWVAERFG